MSVTRPGLLGVCTAALELVAFVAFGAPVLKPTTDKFASDTAGCQ